MQTFRFHRWAPVLTLLAMGCAATAPSQPTQEAGPGQTRSQGPAASAIVSERQMAGTEAQAPNADIDLQGIRDGRYGQPTAPTQSYPKPPKPGTIPMPVAECEVCNVFADGYLNLGGEKVRVTISTETQTIVLSPQRPPGRRYSASGAQDVTFTITGVHCNDTEAWVTGELVDKKGKVQTITIYLNETTQQIIGRGQNDCFVFKGKLKDVQIGELCDDEPPPPPPGDCVCWVTTGGQFEIGNTTYTFTVSRQNVTINNLSTPGVEYQFDLNDDSVTCDDDERTITLPNGAGTIIVRDNGEGQNDPPDELNINIDIANPPPPDLTTNGFIELSRGNIQFHEVCTPNNSL
ncbi:hypothetical protein D3C72_694500 [compost metagenome]